MALCMLPVTALAASGDITVCGIAIDHTTASVTYLKSDGSNGLTATGATESDYTVSYDPATHTLTLNSASVTAPKSGTTAYGINVDTQDVTLNLVGSNTINANTENGMTNGYGIYVSGNKKLTVTGDGNLTVTGSNVSDSNDSNGGNITIGIYAGTLEMNGTGTVTATGGTSTQINGMSEGILLSVDLTANSGTLTANGGNARRSIGIVCTGMCTVKSGAAVNATGADLTMDVGISGGFNGTGIKVQGGTLTANGGAVTGNTAESNGTTLYPSSCGIYASTSIEVTAGSISGIGGAATNGNSYGIKNNGTFTVSGGTTKMSGTTAALSGQNQPDFGTVKWYKWRFSDFGAYTQSSVQDCTLSTTSPFETYVEITPDDIPAFVPVTDITMTNTSTVQVNTDLTLAGTFTPGTATNQTIVWSVDNANGTGATVSNSGVFRATTAGIATVKATIVNGASVSTNYTKTFDIIVTATPPSPEHIHSWANAWSYDNSYHWHECEAGSCPVIANSGKSGYGPHQYSDDQDTTCDCGYVRIITAPDPPVPSGPKITEGMNSQWTQGSNAGLRFKSDADYNDFLRIEVNGNTIPADMYTKSPGSTVVVLKSSYLNTLTTGRYTIGIVFTTGTATTSFDIVAAGGRTEDDNPSTGIPQTGDNSITWPWIAMLFISGGALVVICISGKNKKRKAHQ